MRITAYVVAIVCCHLSSCRSVDPLVELEYDSLIIRALQSDSTTIAVLQKYRRPLDSIVVSPVAFCFEPHLGHFEHVLSSPALPSRSSVDSAYSAFYRMFSRDRYCMEDSSTILERVDPFSNPSARPIAYVSRPYSNVVEHRTMIVGELYLAGPEHGGYEATAMGNLASFITLVALFEGNQLQEFVTGRAER